jgi:hypothetical protein
MTLLTHLVDHVAFWMPAFISHVPIDLHELFENRTVATSTFGGESRRIVEMTINIAVVLII